MTRSRILPPAELTIKVRDFAFEYEMWPRHDDFAFGLKNKLKSTYEVVFQKSKWEPLTAGSRREPPERLVDAWLLRDQFLKIKTPDDALRFFNLSGLIFPNSRPERDERSFIVLFRDVRRCQEMIAEALVSPFAEHTRRGFPQSWLCGLGELPLTLRVVDERPTAEMIFGDGLAAIMATVRIDWAWGAEFQRCIRCRTVFQRESRHQKMYCDYPCAHAAAEQMRRDRTSKGKAKKRLQQRSN